VSATIAAIIWAIGMVVWFFIRRPHQRRARKQAVANHRRSFGERMALNIAVVGVVGIPLVHLLTPLLRFADYPFQPWAGWVGTLMLIAFLWLFYESHRILGKNWSITLEIREEHKLIEDGIYKYVRHPMYSAFWLWAICQAFLFPNWVVGVSGVLCFGVLYFSRVGKEEAMMRQTFGETYDDYCVRTGRVLPKLW
jgi:protein-S-isoprenylcysteine O-methyltransferase Ste14